VTELLGEHAAFDDGPVADADAERYLLRSGDRPKQTTGPPIFVVDLFSGCGGLSLGVGEAAAALGYAPNYSAFDMDEGALGVYGRNLPESRTVLGDLSERIDGMPGARPTRRERAFLDEVSRCDVLVAGPPCQGHSAANNRTRHRDTRNRLYLTAVRAAELLEPVHVVIENVPGASSDRDGVVDRAAEALARLGYRMDRGVIDASALGVPQRRRRLLLLASRSRQPRVEQLIQPDQVKRPRTVRWAFEDLERMRPRRLVDQPARSAPQTLERIDALFDNDLYELPNEFRPPCHAEGGHSYVSIYGRLRWDEPAQTLTTGFYSMCMGRNVHPSRRRTITAHEAARIQGLPDWFSFDNVTKRVELSRMLGNAVPPRLGYAAAMELLR
jgi:DNA (cytosine-5)-methyltransferase 1